MKKLILFQKIFLLALIIIPAASSFAQTEITITSSRENSYCNATCTIIDNPELNGNPDAIIIITPVYGPHGAPKSGYPHPIAVYYINQKWSILYLDNTPIQQGTQFKVQYFLQPGPDRFVYMIPPSGSCVINNANPNVSQSKSFLITQSLAPTLRSGSVQNNSNVEVRFGAKDFNASIKNMDGTQPRIGSAYNIVLSSNVNAIESPGGPTGKAGGDLDDNYPSPSVVKIMGRPFSRIPPNVGQVLKWSGSEWTPANDSTCCTNINTNNTNSTGSQKGQLSLGLNYIIAVQGIFPAQGSTMTQGTMIGEIKLFSGNIAPAGWAICNGQLLPIQQNESLFNVIGTTYGGDGKTNFELPDMRNAVPVGAGLNWQLGERSN